MPDGPAPIRQPGGSTGLSEVGKKVTYQSVAEPSVILGWSPTTLSGC